LGCGDAAPVRALDALPSRKALSMPVSPGSRLGPYEVLSSLGAGGMGEVAARSRARAPRP